MAEQFATDLLIQMVLAHLPADPGRLTFEPIPTGKHNTSYFVRGWERELVLRISPPDDAGFLFYERRMMAQEPQLNRLLRAQTTVPVADILAYDDRRQIVDRDFLLMERLPGRPLTEAALDERRMEGDARPGRRPLRLPGGAPAHDSPTHLASGLRCDVEQAAGRPGRLWRLYL